MTPSGKSAVEEVVLVTGGSGFIGQHLLKYLLGERKSLGIKEVRSLDTLAIANKIGMNCEINSLLSRLLTNCI